MASTQTQVLRPTLANSTSASCGVCPGAPATTADRCDSWLPLIENTQHGLNGRATNEVQDTVSVHKYSLNIRACTDMTEAHMVHGMRCIQKLLSPECRGPRETGEVTMGA